jgi:hypothetical protein
MIVALGWGAGCRAADVAPPSRAVAPATPPTAAATPVRVQRGPWVIALVMTVPTGASGGMAPVEVAFVGVMPDGRVRQLPDSPAEDKGWRRSPPSSAFYLRGPSAFPPPAGDHIEDGDGNVLVACRDGRVYVGAREDARLGPRGFGDDRFQVTIDEHGEAVVSREGQPVAFRYDGLSPGDFCTAALLFNMIPAPRAAG